MSKPLSARAVDSMKPGDNVKVDVGENSGLRVSCGKGGTKAFIYRYKSPGTGELTHGVVKHLVTTRLSRFRQPNDHS